MATRPIFAPLPHQVPFVHIVDLEFQWHPGFSVAQAQRSIASLHSSAAKKQYSPVLEISSKSPTPLGVKLSAFNLELQYSGRTMSVECAFQGSKVFERGGPYHELYAVPSRAAKQDPRISTSGRLVGFRFFEQTMPTQPITAFYDWLYLLALVQNLELQDALLQYKAFSDIAFNPEKSWNCQARSAALFVALVQNHDVSELVSDLPAYLQLISGAKLNKDDKGSNLTQMKLPW